MTKTKTKNDEPSENSSGGTKKKGVRWPWRKKAPKNSLTDLAIQQQQEMARKVGGGGRGSSNSRPTASSAATPLRSHATSSGGTGAGGGMNGRNPPGQAGSNLLTKHSYDSPNPLQGNNTSYAAATAASYDYRVSEEASQNQRYGRRTYGTRPRPELTSAVSYRVPMKDGSSHGTSNNHRMTTPAMSNIKRRSHNFPIKASWLCNTKYFRKVCDDVFDSIDSDGTGAVDEKELYTGILLIHLKLGMYLGPVACRPLERWKCQSIFKKMDIDRSGALDREEFRHVMMFLFGNVLLRVLVQWFMTLTVVPLVAKKIINFVTVARETVTYFVHTLDERRVMAYAMEMALQGICNLFLRFIAGHIMFIISELLDLLDSIPPTVWDVLPLTILSSVLGMVVVPRMIFRIDDFFQRQADRKSTDLTANYSASQPMMRR